MFPRVVVAMLLDPWLISVIPLGWKNPLHSKIQNQQSSIVNQTDLRNRHGSDSFFAADEAHGFVGGGFDADSFW